MRIKPKLTEMEAESVLGLFKFVGNLNNGSGDSQLLNHIIWKAETMGVKISRAAIGRAWDKLSKEYKKHQAAQIVKTYMWEERYAVPPSERTVSEEDFNRAKEVAGKVQIGFRAGKKLGFGKAEEVGF